MRYLRGLALLAALAMTAGCASTEQPTTQTSMLRGPTPSSGMSIPQLLQVPAGTTSENPAAPAESVAPAQTPTDDAVPTDAATDVIPTDESTADDPLTESTDGFVVPTDQFGDVTGDTADGGSADSQLSALAARFSCQDYAQQPPDASATDSGACLLDDQQVLLYSFSTDQAAADYAASLADSGVTSDQMVQGPGYVIWSDAGPIAKIKAALGAG